MAAGGLYYYDSYNNTEDSRRRCSLWKCLGSEGSPSWDVCRCGVPRAFMARWLLFEGGREKKILPIQMRNGENNLLKRMRRNVQEELPWTRDFFAQKKKN